MTEATPNFVILKLSLVVSMLISGFLCNATIGKVQLSSFICATNCNIPSGLITLTTGLSVFFGLKHLCKSSQSALSYK